MMTLQENPSVAFDGSNFELLHTFSCDSALGMVYQVVPRKRCVLNVMPWGSGDKCDKYPLVI